MSVMHESTRLDELEIGELAVLYDDQEPEDVLRWGFESFGDRIALVTSFQNEGMVLLDLAVRIHPDVRVLTIDTGRFHEETHRFIDQVRNHYGINIEVHYPDADEVRKLVTQRGVNLFYESVANRMMCCQVRKVRPLQRALDGLDAWITGLRRDQWASRVNIRKIELDHDHDAIVKLSPLADWADDEVHDYIRRHGVPTHPLYAHGYPSIGCAPCTRAIEPGEKPRAGRWWWEKDAPKECGMHCSLETGGFEKELDAILRSNQTKRVSLL